MDALLADLGAEFGETRLFRPYRDTRFSRDKSPYKTAIAARVGDGYVQLSADGLLAGAGCVPHDARTARPRTATPSWTTGPVARCRTVVDALGGTGLESAPWRRSRRRRGAIPKDHPAHRAAPHKGLVAITAWPPPAGSRTAACEDAGRSTCSTTAAPLLSWLHGHVGPADVTDCAQSVFRRRPP